MKRTYTLSELPEVAGMILENTASRNLLLYGEMGVGKTTLVKELAAKLGVKETLSSPTFSIVNEYLLPEGKLFHFDFYRIEKEEEALDIGVEEYFDSNDWNCIEWPERIQSLLPKNSTIIKITKNNNGSRTIQLQ